VEVATDSGWFLPPYGTKFLKIKVKFVAKLNKYGKLANDPSSSSPPTIPCDVARGLSRLSFVPYIETSSKFEPGSSLFHQTYKIFMTLWVTTGGGGGGGLTKNQKYVCKTTFRMRFLCFHIATSLILLLQTNIGRKAHNLINLGSRVPCGPSSCFCHCYRVTLMTPR
jgi:hypothetical protein